MRAATHQGRGVSSAHSPTGRTPGAHVQGLLGLPQASPLADNNPCPLPTANLDSENRALRGREASQGVVQLEGISGTLDLQVVSELGDLRALGSP